MFFALTSLVGFSQIQIVDEIAIDEYSGKVIIQAEGEIGPFKVELFSFEGGGLVDIAIDVNGQVEFGPHISSDTYQVVVTPERYNSCSKVLYPVVPCNMPGTFSVNSTPSSNCNGTIQVNLDGTARYYFIQLYDKDDIRIDYKSTNSSQVVFEELCEGRYTVKISGQGDNNNCTLEYPAFIY
ncbi:MAG: hypothetical protein AAF849_02810 [Bacteroidota bacterium]